MSNKNTILSLNSKWQKSSVEFTNTDISLEQYFNFKRAFSYSNCENCGIEVSTPHIPSYSLCDDCAGDDKCVQCGNSLKDE